MLWYTGFMKYLGEEKGRDFMRKLAAQKPAFRDSETVISVESLSKRYLVGHEGPQERYDVCLQFQPSSSSSSAPRASPRGPGRPTSVWSR